MSRLKRFSFCAWAAICMISPAHSQLTPSHRLSSGFSSYRIVRRRPMDKCYLCQADTQLYINKMPICLKCAEDLSDGQHDPRDRQKSRPEDPPLGI